MSKAPTPEVAYRNGAHFAAEVGMTLALQILEDIETIISQDRKLSGGIIYDIRSYIKQVKAALRYETKES